MAIKPGVKGPGAMVGSFQDENVPGVVSGDASRAVAGAAKGTSPERIYAGITRNVRVTNRAEKGERKGKPFYAVVDSQPYPPEAIREDKETWLQPGESMDIPREAAVAICGDCFSPNNLVIDGPDIIRKYGDFQFKAQNADGTITGKNIQLIPIGPPKHFPDLIVQQVDSRGRNVGPAISIYEKYISESVFRTGKSVNPVDDDD